jgi:PIN domain nuclease of toxin-antitoxin system
MLEAKRRVKLDRPCEEWVRAALDVPGVRLAPLTAEIAIDSTRLDLHGDPADRILVATARRLGARLMTADWRLLEYGAKHRLPIASA